MASMMDGVPAVGQADMRRHGDAVAGETAASAFGAVDPSRDARDAARFALALGRAQDGRDALAQRAEPTRAVRDTVLDAARALDRDWAAATRLSMAPLHAGRWGPADMLALQGRLLQASMQMDLASKLVQKSTQAVDQLVRIQ